MVEDSQAWSWPYTRSREIFYSFKYIKAFNSALPFLLFLLFYYFLDLLDPNLNLLFLKNALLSPPFGQSLPEEIKFPFFLARFARSVFMKKTLTRAASTQSFKLFCLQSQECLKIKMPYFGFSTFHYDKNYNGYCNVLQRLQYVLMI